MADVTDIIDYYVNLLIIQYHDKPKAMATIELMAETFEASGIFLDIQNGYNLANAVGVQLDVLGKYEGVDRFYRELNLADYFSLITYGEVAVPPDTPPRYGFTDYADYDTTPPNGCLVYSEVISANNQLVDDVFRQLIQLAIFINYSNFSSASIDNGLWPFFGSSVRKENQGNMAMAYFIGADQPPLLQAVLYKKMLPAPMGVGVNIVSDVDGLMFSLADYSGYESPFGNGFTDYADYDSVSGQTLIYAQITGL